MQHPHLEGLIAAPYTAFHADGSLHLEAIDKQAELLAKNGVAGAFVCGTTGEGASLTTAERMQIAERWVAVSGGRLKVLVHVGHTSLAECKALAAHAQKIGADGVANLAPFFFKPGVEELVAFCAEVAAAAPALPYYYYHIPSMTGVGMPVIDILQRAAEAIPNLRGVKFTHENLMDYSQCVGFENGRFDIVFGRDEILLAGLAMGARAAIGSTYNFCAPLFRPLLDAYRAGDLTAARRHQAFANETIAVFLRHGGLPAGKAIMGMIGCDCGPVRLPLKRLGVEQIAALRKNLERVGFFDACGAR